MAGFRRGGSVPAVVKAAPVIKGTDQQEHIWDLMCNSKKHLVIKAFAGTGKTFSMLHGLKLAKEKGILPHHVTFTAFNKSIADELASKVPQGVSACTMHSLGFSALKYDFNKRGIKLRSDSYKGYKIMDELLGNDKNSFPKGAYFGILSIADFMKNNCVGNVDKINGKWTYSSDWAEIVELIEEYSIDLREEHYAGVQMYFDDYMTESLRDERTCDFGDMIWQPVVKDISMLKADWLIVDEAQDMNSARHRLACKAGERIMIVGDEYQAIYGFCGADHNSMTVMQKMLGKVDVGYLTKTRRCPKSHVEAVKKFVPNFEAMPEAPEGSLEKVSSEDALSQMGAGDMVLCRVNAPLIHYMFTCLRNNKPAYVRGRDIGSNLTKLVRRLDNGGMSVQSFIPELREYAENERTKLSKRRYGLEAKLAALQDRVDCLEMFATYDGIHTTKQLTDRIDSIFKDTADDQKIQLSSIHKAKGLEADKVWILKPELMPHPMAKTGPAKQQEANCEYVARTRSKNILIDVVTDQEEEGRM